jgi:hypothetical protein
LGVGANLSPAPGSINFSPAVLAKRGKYRMLGCQVGKGLVSKMQSNLFCCPSEAKCNSKTSSTTILKTLFVPALSNFIL